MEHYVRAMKSERFKTLITKWKKKLIQKAYILYEFNHWYFGKHKITEISRDCWGEDIERKDRNTAQAVKLLTLT